MLFQTGCFVDTLSLINGFLTYCVLTDFLQARWINSQIMIKVMQTIVWGSRFSQMITVLMIATNRMTAIRYPLRHSRIWNKATVHVCSIIQVASMMILGGIAAAILQPIRIPSTFGGVVSAMAIDPVYQKTSALVSLILQSTNAFFVLFFYIIILRDIRAALSKIPSNSNFAHEGNLHKIAFIVCMVEVIRETSTCIYIVRTALYNSIPPYLLVIFSKNVRHQLSIMLTIKSRQPKNQVFSMDTVTN
ncbi:hypothetical protein PRIPAC_88450 [Pristionchus pacificus]|uniref:G protein-coupled receptor n=1 Tax=Pristionchus pacificus TaxID=54126 RepID=A0A2A6CX94_PRIPA|nr:hypothetical protein PRIPAC_88450 [Pristionchus pacificus]|eukprot:PDM82758.1 G protein-coupled receptor [Pristionchus pacificus]